MDEIRSPDDVEPPKPVVFNQGKVFSFPVKRDLGELSDGDVHIKLHLLYVASHEAMYGKDG